LIGNVVRDQLGIWDYIHDSLSWLTCLQIAARQIVLPAVKSLKFQV
jgi:hypothetical protein